MAYVDALRVGLTIHAPKGFRFAVMTDDPSVGPWAIPFRHGWSGWWSKLELFRPGVFDGPVLYMDLDTIPVGDLSSLVELAAGGGRAILADFYQPTRMVGSGVMCWTPDATTAAAYDAARDARFTMSGRLDYYLRGPFGDATRIQDVVPGVVSLKPLRGPRPIEHPQPDDILVCGHGRPRFHDPAAGWAHRVWLARSRGERRVR